MNLQVTRRQFRDFLGGWMLRVQCYCIWQVNVEGVDTSKDWPDFGKAEYWECELQAGEMLYIPLKWSVFPIALFCLIIFLVISSNSKTN